MRIISPDSSGLQYTDEHTSTLMQAMNQTQNAKGGIFSSSCVLLMSQYGHVKFSVLTLKI